MNGKMDLIRDKYEMDAKRLGYNLSSDLKLCAMCIIRFSLIVVAFSRKRKSRELCLK